MLHPVSLIVFIILCCVGGARASVSNSKEAAANPFQNMFGKKTAGKKDVVEDKVEKTLSTFILPDIPMGGKFAGRDGIEVQGLSRVLVWLMAPVAAEYLKYGKTIVSDPRRSVRLLSVLEKVQAGEGSAGVEGRGDSSVGEGVSRAGMTVEDVLYSIPLEEEDKKVLLQWAFFEATSLIRQYGDLLEDVNSYLGTGTSTVGECVLLVEDELK